MASRALPIILCGQQIAIAQVVKKNLLPEIEVKHIVISTSSGASEIPSILRDIKPKPVAVVVGAAYTGDDIKQMQSACGDEKEGVYWLHADKSVSMPSLPPQQYGMLIIERVKKRMAAMDREGRFGKAKTDEVALY